MRRPSSYKVPGFTLIELIVAMVLSAILVGVFYWIYLYAGKQLRLYHQKQADITALVLFKNALLNDIDQCNYIASPDGKVYYFVFDTDTVTYSLYPVVKMKRSTITDSFNITISHVQPAYRDLLRGVKVVRTINFSISKPFEIKDIAFTKYYSSQQLMNVPQ